MHDTLNVVETLRGWLVWGCFRSLGVICPGRRLWELGLFLFVVLFHFWTWDGESCISISTRNWLKPPRLWAKRALLSLSYAFGVGEEGWLPSLAVKYVWYWTSRHIHGLCKRLTVFVRWILRSDILETDSQVIVMLKKSWPEACEQQEAGTARRKHEVHVEADLEVRVILRVWRRGERTFPTGRLQQTDMTSRFTPRASFFTRDIGKAAASWLLDVHTTFTIIKKSLCVHWLLRHCLNKVYCCFNKVCWAFFHMLVIPAPSTLRNGECELETSLGYILSSFPRN